MAQQDPIESFIYQLGIGDGKSGKNNLFFVFDKNYQTGRGIGLLESQRETQLKLLEEAEAQTRILEEQQDQQVDESELAIEALYRLQADQQEIAEATKVVADVESNIGALDEFRKLGALVNLSTEKLLAFVKRLEPIDERLTWAYGKLGRSYRDSTVGKIAVPVLERMKAELKLRDHNAVRQSILERLAAAKPTRDQMTHVAAADLPQLLAAAAREAKGYFDAVDKFLIWSDGDTMARVREARTRLATTVTAKLSEDERGVVDGALGTEMVGLLAETKRGLPLLEAYMVYWAKRRRQWIWLSCLTGLWCILLVLQFDLAWLGWAYPLFVVYRAAAWAGAEGTLAEIHRCLEASSKNAASIFRVANELVANNVDHRYCDYPIRRDPLLVQALNRLSELVGLFA